MFKNTFTKERRIARLKKKSENAYTVSENLATLCNRLHNKSKQTDSKIGRRIFEAESDLLLKLSDRYEAIGDKAYLKCYD